MKRARTTMSLQMNQNHKTMKKNWRGNILQPIQIQCPKKLGPQWNPKVQHPLTILRKSFPHQSSNLRGECSWPKIKPRPTNKDNINIKRATPSSFRTGNQDKNEWEDIETEELKTLGEDETVNYHIEFNFKGGQAFEVFWTSKTITQAPDVV